MIISEIATVTVGEDNILPHFRTVAKNREYLIFVSETNNSFVGEPLAAPSFQNGSEKSGIPKFCRQNDRSIVGTDVPDGPLQT